LDPARSADMGDTTSIDMGSSFRFIFRRFHVHVVERNVLFGAATAVCEVGIERPTKHVAIVSVVRVEP
jgi:hypothetical protein